MICFTVKKRDFLFQIKYQKRCFGKQSLQIPKRKKVNKGKFNSAKDYESKKCKRLFKKNGLKTWLIHN